MEREIVKISSITLLANSEHARTKMNGNLNEREVKFKY